ncbi:MAG TPA: LysM peptidoglycan-binding domain-containing protein [Candidatus Saccharimonadales bacterium]|nr:LysM peptidoglycan-binding domain-containing protein [Candidatus Saccharimonadales bacterium]
MKQSQRLVSALMAAVLLVIPASAAAINYGGVGGRPANPLPNNPRSQSIFIYQLKPGQHASDAVLVQNNTDQTQTISLDAVDSELASGGNFTCKQAVEPKTDVGAWITLSQTSVTVAANGMQTVPFSVDVPSSGISVGEHDGCITLQAASQTATPSAKSGIVLSFRSAIRVAVTIPGTIIKKLTITNLSAAPTDNRRYTATAALQNEGNVSLDTTQTISVVTVFGTVVSSAKQGSTPVLPHSQASVSSTIGRPFWGGWYRLKDTASYNANPTAGIGDTTDVATKTVSRTSGIFLVAPAPLAALIEVLLLLVLGGAIYWIIYRSHHRRHVNRHWHSYTVKKGDSVEKLADQYGLPWKKIVAANKLKPPYTLSPGHVLKLPPSSKE